MHAQSLTCVRLFATPWTVARHSPLSVKFSRQQYWSRMPFPSHFQEFFLTQGSNPHLLQFLHWQGRFFTAESPHSSLFQLMTSCIFLLRSKQQKVILYSVLSLINPPIPNSSQVLLTLPSKSTHSHVQNFSCAISSFCNMSLWTCIGLISFRSLNERDV